MVPQSGWNVFGWRLATALLLLDDVALGVPFPSINVLPFLLLIRILIKISLSSLFITVIITLPIAGVVFDPITLDHV